MYRVIIADDEPLVLVGMKTMLEHNPMNIEISSTARNGREAWEQIQSTQPDIVIIDIRMPIMDGLEVIEHASDEIEHPPYFIIMSSYSDFEYARKAMRFSIVKDYLTKLEVDQASLYTVLQRTIECIVENRVRQNREYSTAQLGINDRALKDRFFLKLLNHWFSDDTDIIDTNKDLHELFYSSAYVAILVQAQTNQSVTFSADELAKKITYLIESIASFKQPYHILSWGQREVVIILTLSSFAQEPLQDMLPIFEQLRSSLHNYLNQTIRLGIGKVVPQLFDLNQSLDAAMFALISQKDTICFSKNDSCQTVLNVSDICKRLSIAFESLNSLELNACFSDLKISLDIMENRFEHVITICSRLLHCIDVSANGSNLIWENIYGPNIDPFSSLDDLHKNHNADVWLEHLQQGLNSWFETEYERNQNWLVPAIKRYIDEHISDSLSLTTVANAFDISGGYVCMLFKKYSSEGFGDFVTKQKIKCACKLLVETDQKIYDISAKLGYSDPYYFSKVFKKMTNKSPREYRLSN